MSSFASVRFPESNSSLANALYAQSVSLGALIDLNISMAWLMCSRDLSLSPSKL